MATRGLPRWPQADADADTLAEGARLLLDAARAWAAPGPAGPLPQASLVLAAEDLGELALPLDSALRRLPGLVLACPLCPRLAAEESALIAALAAIQRGQRSLGLAVLQSLAPPLQAYQAMPALIAVASAMARAGLSLTRG
ncbi:MAG: hypothetical protein K2X11_19270 [Acetobacteraceae bacterium]|nr:hypothetical protein [Acetobacteraceae bacterium]